MQRPESSYSVLMIMMLTMGDVEVVKHRLGEVEDGATVEQRWWHGNDASM